MRTTLRLSGVRSRAAGLLLTMLLAAACLPIPSASAVRADAPPVAARSLVFALDLRQIAAGQHAAILEETARVFADRLTALGTPSSEIRREADDMLVVSLAEDVDLPEVSATLNGRGIVDFRERDEGGASWKPIQERDADGELRTVTSAYFIRRSRVVLDPSIQQPLVAFEFDDDGARLFEAATRRLMGQPLAIFHDDELIAAPLVRSDISREGVIAGLGQREAWRLTIQLNSGPLPVYVNIRP